MVTYIERSLRILKRIGSNMNEIQKLSLGGKQMEENDKYYESIWIWKTFL